jgi:hypothetical protein
MRWEMILAAFAKLGKATVGFVISLCPHVRMEKFGSHWTDVHEIRKLSIYRKSVDKVQVSLKYDKYFT